MSLTQLESGFRTHSKYPKILGQKNLKNRFFNPKTWHRRIKCYIYKSTYFSTLNTLVMLVFQICRRKVVKKWVFRWKIAKNVNFDGFSHRKYLQNICSHRFDTGNGNSGCRHDFWNLFGIFKSAAFRLSTGGTFSEWCAPLSSILRLPCWKISWTRRADFSVTAREAATRRFKKGISEVILKI